MEETGKYNKEQLKKSSEFMTGASCLQVRMREVDVCMGTACFINKNILSSKRWHELLRLIK